MSTDRPENDGMLPGLELPKPEAGPVAAAYSKAIEALRELDVLKPEHEGIAANLLRLAAVIDHERKGYAVAHASTAAAALMQTLLDLVPADEVDDEWARIMMQIQEPQQ